MPGFPARRALSQVHAVERATRSQSASRVWFRQRAGRVTASKLKQVLKTNPQQPSKSLIKGICYPEAYRFTTVATRYLGFELGKGKGKIWGMRHEQMGYEQMFTVFIVDSWYGQP